jgi:hypothetical protein
MSAKRRRGSRVRESISMDRRGTGYDGFGSNRRGVPWRRSGSRR